MDVTFEGFSGMPQDYHMVVEIRNGSVVTDNQNRSRHDNSFGG